MIPANLDYLCIFNELNAKGISDYKIEAMCSLTDGHISHMRAGHWHEMTYQRAARVYNLWFEEVQRLAPVPENTQGLALTT